MTLEGNQKSCFCKLKIRLGRCGLWERRLKCPGVARRWEAARRWRRWEVMNSVTVDDLGGWMCMLTSLRVFQE